MSKALKVSMNLDVKDLHPSSGVLMKQALKEADPKQPDAVVDSRGFKERTGPEVFAVIAGGAIGGSFPRGSFEQLKNYDRIVKNIDLAVKSGELIANKTDIDIIKDAVNKNPNWPNNTEFFKVLTGMMVLLDGAVEITENPSEGLQKNVKT